MDIIIKDLKSQIKKTLGIDCILAPQKAKGNTSVIILEFNGIEGAGEPFENEEGKGGTVPGQPPAQQPHRGKAGTAGHG